MTDQTNVESGQGAGAVGSPVQPASGTPGTQTSAIDVKALAEALRPVVEDVVHRSGQSVKDKRFGKLQAGQDELLARYDALLQEMTPAKARRELRIDQLLEGTLGQDDNHASPGAGGNPMTAQTTSVDTTALLAPMGLQANDPEVIKIQREEVDPMQQVIKFANLAQRRQAAQQAPPNPAIIASAGTGVTVSTTTEALMAEYQNLTKNIPPGERGIEGRHQAKIAIRQKALAAGVQPPV